MLSETCQKTVHKLSDNFPKATDCQTTVSSIQDFGYCVTVHGLQGVTVRGLWWWWEEIPLFVTKLWHASAGGVEGGGGTQNLFKNCKTMYSPFNIPFFKNI